jgi:hypothetical protein
MDNQEDVQDRDHHKEEEQKGVTAILCGKIMWNEIGLLGKK